MAFYVDNAISWAQWRIRGGWKNWFVINGCYLAAAVFFIALPYQIAQTARDKSSILEVSSIFILVIQLVMMLLLAGLTIANSLRRDLTSKLIESHRLMPLAPVQAIVGYIAGAVLSIASLCAINLVLGAILCQIRNIPVQGWLIANGLLLGFAIAVWSAMAMTTFISRVIFGGLIACFFGITFSGGFIFVIAPGLLAFCSPMHGRTIFDYPSIDMVTTGTVVAVGAQFLIAILCIRGAARKYAEADAVGLTLGPALATLGIWAGLSWVGIAQFHDLRPEFLRYSDIDWRLPVVGAIGSSLLVALLPMAAMAWGRIKARESSMGAEELIKPRRRMRLGFLAGLSACVLFAVSPVSSRIDSRIFYRTEGWNYYVPPPTAGGAAIAAPAPQVGIPVPIISKDRKSDPAAIAVASTIFLVQSYFLMLLLYPRLKRANLVILFLTAMLWFVPLLADVFYYSEKGEEPKLDFMGVFSPIGSITQGLNDPAKWTWIGIAGQAILCAMIGVIVLSLPARRPKGPPPLPVGLAGEM
jgi:hypothetical protein